MDSDAQYLPELQDLVHKELFSQDEVRAIIKKRKQYEHALLRRTAKKAHYLRYVQYEMNLESLRQKRQKRQKSISLRQSS
jgi:U3 small nucleolar RNA-associated protein 6